MINPESRSLSQVDTISGLELEQQRLLALASLNIPDSESVPVFDEAAQTAAHFLGASICLLSFIERERQWFQAAVGLSRIGLMNDLAASRQLPRIESFCNTVIETQHVFTLEDATMHPEYAESRLVQRYGIRAYLGVPLFSSEGYCLGTLAVLELKPRQFTRKDEGFLELIARWSMSEFERNRLLKRQGECRILGAPELPTPITAAMGAAQPAQLVDAASANVVKASLITQMVQELRTPLTSILGMASVLNREIYGPLTDKQKKYLDIVHSSSQDMLSLVNETVELGTLDALDQPLDLADVDVEMLCQQSLAPLQEVAQRREQSISLTMEPGQRTWYLDKTKVRQMLYHLVFRVIQASSPGSLIRIHISRKLHQLNLSIWTSHPWLGEGLPQSEVQSDLANLSIAKMQEAPLPQSLLQSSRLSPSTKSMQSAIASHHGQSSPMISNTATESKQELSDEERSRQTRHNLGLMLSRALVELHRGGLSLQGSLETGYRYVLSLPQLNPQEDNCPL